MPKTTALNGAKHSTSIAQFDFLVRPYYPCAPEALKHFLWRKFYSLRRAILRKFELSRYRYERKNEIARCTSGMRPSFVFTPHN